MALGEVNLSLSKRQLPEHLAPQLNRNPEKIRRDFIYTSAKEIGADLMLATEGEYITEDNLHALQLRGCLDYSTRDILDSYFDDLEDLNNDVRQTYVERLEEDNLKKQQVLAEIARSQIPDNLFSVVKFEGGMGYIQDESVDEEEKITRYSKFTLAKQLLQEVKKDISEQRLVGIAMGIFLEDESLEGKKISSYQSEIRRASTDNILQADVEIAAEVAGRYDLIYPERKKAYLASIKNAATKPIIVPLREKQNVYDLTTPEVSIDIKRKRLLVGAEALRAALERGSKRESIHKIGELLLKDSVEYRLGRLDPYQYKSWDRQEYIRYGRWLLTVIEPQRGRLNARLIARARKLDLGPGIDAIASKFSGLPEFYRALDINARSKGRFSHWALEDWVAWASLGSAENGGKITRDIIVTRSQQNSNEPTWKMMKNGAGTLSRLVEAMGLEPYHKMTSLEACVQRGIQFVEQTGRMPQKSDFREDTVLPGLNPIYKYCGGIVNFRNLISEELSKPAYQMAA